MFTHAMGTDHFFYSIEALFVHVAIIIPQHDRVFECVLNLHSYSVELIGVYIITTISSNC